MENAHATQTHHQDPMLNLRSNPNIRETGSFRRGRWDGCWRARTMVLCASSTDQEQFQRLIKDSRLTLQTPVADLFGSVLGTYF